MKFNLSFVLFRVITIFAAFVMLSSCEKDVYSPADEINSSRIMVEDNLKKDKGKGKGRNNQNDPPADPVDPVVDPFVSTYQLDQADDFDPLFRFSISQSGELMLLETDPTVTSWDTDYWGYWSDPFPYTNNEVNYIIGLTNTSYHFQSLPDNKIDVTKILIVQPYPSGTPTTTITHPGVYNLVN
jgi:hypothetical protein